MLGLLALAPSEAHVTPRVLPDSSRQQAIRFGVFAVALELAVHGLVFTLIIDHGDLVELVVVPHRRRALKSKLSDQLVAVILIELRPSNGLVLFVVFVSHDLVLHIIVFEVLFFFLLVKIVVSKGLIHLTSSVVARVHLHLALGQV